MYLKCLGVFVIVFLAGCGGEGKKNCDAFATQSEAQAYFEAHNASNLDRDNDGIACEHLPDNQPMENNFDLTYFIGSYSLIGESCGAKGCSIQTAQLEVLSENTIAFCINKNLESNCINNNAAIINVSNIDKYLFLGENLEVKFGYIQNGHVELKSKDTTYYGQSMLQTDLSKNGYYHQNGILLNDDESYSLSSKAGRVISWSKTDGLVLSSN